MGKAATITPKASHKALQSAIPLIYSAFSADVGLNVGVQNLCSMGPSRHAIKNLVNDQATSAYLRMIEKFKKIRSFMC